MAPRILQETNISSKASKNLLPKENLPKGTKDHERNGEKGGGDGRNLGIVELH
jgi:hypothetical protein